MCTCIVHKVCSKYNLAAIEDLVFDLIAVTKNRWSCAYESTSLIINIYRPQATAARWKVVHLHYLQILVYFTFLYWVTYSLKPQLFKKQIKFRTVSAVLVLSMKGFHA